MANTNLNYTLNLKNFFSKGMKQAVDDTKRLDDQMGKMNNTLKTVGKGIAAYFSLNAIASFGKAVVDSLKNYEYFSASLRTLLRGDKNMAGALEKQLVNLAGITPFSLVDVQQGAKQLLAYGFQANKVVGNMKMLGDISSGVGAPLSDIVYLYGTLRTQGRAFSKDINQFTMRGINLLPELAKQFGVTEDKVMSLVEAGKVGFADVEKAFKSMTSEGGIFFKMMEEQSQTVGGRIERLGDAWEQLKVNIGKSQTGIISGTVNFFSKMLEMINTSLSSSNAVEDSIKKYGAKGFGEGFFSSQKNAKEKVEKENLKTLYQGYSDRISTMMGSETEVEKLKNVAGLRNLMAESARSISTALKFRTLIGREETDRRVAVLKGVQDRIQGQLSLLNQKDFSGGKTGAGGDNSGEPPVSSTEWSGARAQNITINVTKLVETLNIEAADVSEGVNKGAAMTKKALLELLNDANQIANR